MVGLAFAMTALDLTKFELPESQRATSVQSRSKQGSAKPVGSKRVGSKPRAKIDLTLTLGLPDSRISGPIAMLAERAGCGEVHTWVHSDLPVQASRKIVSGNGILQARFNG